MDATKIYVICGPQSNTNKSHYFIVTTLEDFAAALNGERAGVTGEAYVSYKEALMARDMLNSEAANKAPGIQ